MKAAYRRAVLIAISAVLMAIGTYFIVAAGMMRYDPVSLALAFLIGVCVLAFPLAISEITVDRLETKLLMLESEVQRMKWPIAISEIELDKLESRLVTLESEVEGLNATLGKIGTLAAKFDKSVSAA